jgi:hypothetical protein
MIEFVQETDSKVIFPMPEGIFNSNIEPINETIGELSIPYFQVPDATGLIKYAWDTTQKTLNHNVAKEARKLLSKIEEMVSEFQEVGFDLCYLPSLRAFNEEDGSVLIEWIFADFRIGFTIECNPEESGWYLVSNKKLGEISASGYILNIDIDKLILWLLNYILSNS